MIVARNFNINAKIAAFAALYPPSKTESGISLNAGSSKTRLANPIFVVIPRTIPLVPINPRRVNKKSYNRPFPSSIKANRRVNGRLDNVPTKGTTLTVKRIVSKNAAKRGIIIMDGI